MAWRACCRPWLFPLYKTPFECSGLQSAAGCWRQVKDSLTLVADTLSLCVYSTRKQNKTDFLGEICPRKHVSVKRRSLGSVLKHSCLMDIRLRAASGNPSLANGMTNSALGTAFQDLTCFHTEELLDMKSLAAACPLLPYCPTQVTRKLRFVNMRMGFKIPRA